MANYQTGRAAIEAAAEEAQRRREGGGDFRPLVPKIFWGTSEAGEEKYILFLNPVEDFARIPDAITHIPQTREKADGTEFTYFEEVIPRNSEIQESPDASDPMIEQWDAQPKDQMLAVAV